MRASLGWLAGTAAFGLTLLAVGADVDAAGCLKDTDCKGNRVCQQGQCIDPTKVDPTQKACTKDTDCPGDEICTNKACGKAGAAPSSSATPPGSAPPVGPEPPPTAAPSSYPPGTLPPGSAPPGTYPTASPPPTGGYPGSYPAQPPPPAGGYPQGTAPAGNYPAPPPGYGYMPPPDAQGQDGAPTEYRSKGLMIAGAVLLPVGFVALMAGAIGGAISAAESTTYDYYGYNDSTGDFPPEAAAPIVLGGVAMITGIIFLSIGAPKVAVEAQPAAAVTVTPLVGPTSAAIRLSF